MLKFPEFPNDPILPIFPNMEEEMRLFAIQKKKEWEEARLAHKNAGNCDMWKASLSKPVRELLDQSSVFAQSL